MIWKYIHAGHLGEVHDKLHERVPMAESHGFLITHRNKRRELHWKRGRYYAVAPDESVSKYYCASVDIVKSGRQYWYKNIAPVRLPSWRHTVKSEAFLPEYTCAPAEGRRRSLGVAHA